MEKFKEHKIFLFVVILIVVSGAAVLISRGTREYESSRFAGRPENCKKEFTLFGASPLRIKDIDYIIPMGRMSGEHVTPTDHQYFHPPVWTSDPTPREIISPGDGFITKIERLNFQAYPGRPAATDYHVFIEHSCSVSTMYIHITEFSDRINSLAGAVKPGSSKKFRIPVQAGEVIGAIRGFADTSIYQLDFSVIDTETKLPGLLTPSFYESEAWKIHIADPFDYFDQTIRNQLLAKNLRSAEPLGGKIDYDIDGKLAGNWFRQGYKGYTPQQPRYWEQELTLAYDHLDPAQIRISLGNYQGRPEQFGVGSNSPDPAEVGVGERVKYELVHFEYFKASGERWNRQSFARNIKAENQKQVEGVVLFELSANKTLKAEVFPGQTANQVSDFTGNAVVYER